MKDFLKQSMGQFDRYDSDWTSWRYAENLNQDVANGFWLESETSFIYKVSVLAAIDANKCDWADIAIGIQRSPNSRNEFIGLLRFKHGENDDIGRVLIRALNLINNLHPAFE